MDYINGKFSRVLNAGDLQEQINELKTKTDALETGKQDKLIDSENIRSIDNISLLGPGNIPFKTFEGVRLTGTGDIKLKTVGSVNLLGPGNINFKEINGVDIIGEGEIKLKQVNGQEIVGEGNILNKDLIFEINNSSTDNIIYNGLSPIRIPVVTLTDDQVITGQKTFKNIPLVFTAADDSEVGKIEYNTEDSYFDFYSNYSTRFYVSSGEDLTAFVLRKNENIAAAYPLNDQDLSLGSSTNRWSDIYFAGQLKDGHNIYYGLVLPNTISYTENKVIATTRDVERETNRAINAEELLATNLQVESERAVEAEAALNTRIDNLDLPETSADGYYIKAVSQEDGLVSAELHAFDTDINIDSEINSPTTHAVKTYIDNRVDSLDLEEVGADGNYVKFVGQENGQLSASVQVFDTTLEEATDDNAPTTKAVKTYIDNRIDSLDLETVGEDGNYIKFVSQENGQVDATVQAFDTDFEDATNNNAPTTKAVKDYADTLDSEVVHITSDEVIYDTKTFAGQAVFDNPVLVKDSLTDGSDLEIAVSEISTATNLENGEGNAALIQRNEVQNLARGDSSIALGRGNTMRHALTFAYGDCLTSTTDHQVLFGTYNDLSSNAKFVVGNGTGINNRSNLFSINADGSLTLGHTTITEEKLGKLLDLLDALEAKEIPEE